MEFARNQMWLLSVFVAFLLLIKWREFPMLSALALVIAFFEPLRTPFLDPNIAWVQASSAQSFIYMFLVASLFNKDQIPAAVTRLIPWGLALDAVWIYLQNPSFLTGPSVDTALFALFLPILYWWRQWIPAALCSIVIAKERGAAAYLVLFSMSAYWLWCRYRQWAVAYVVSVVALGNLFRNTEFMSDNGRLKMWSVYMQWWWEHANHWIGSGLGTFAWIGPTIDVGQKWTFIWMHNDWLQLLFEGGYIGFGAGVLLCLRLWGVASSRLRVVLIGFGAFMLVYSPLRTWIIPLMIVLSFGRRGGLRPI